MQCKKVATNWVKIFIAGDLVQLKQACRKFCYEIGLCVTVKPIDFVYPGVEEAGAEIGLINYPRFPATEQELWDKAVSLAVHLRESGYQDSFCVMSPVVTYWYSRKDEHR